MEYVIMNMCEHGMPVHIMQETSDPNENKFKPDVTDFLFALKAFVLGYFFTIWVFLSWQGWGVTVFTTVYLYSVNKYLNKKDSLVRSRESIFWWIITWVVGISYALWDNRSLSLIRGFFLFCSAVYYVIVASGRTVMGRTGNYLLLDGINALFFIPFGNFLNQYVSVKGLRWGTEKQKKTISIVAGLLLALFLVMCLNPLLSRADSGGFRIVSGFIASIFALAKEYLKFIHIYLFFTIPIAAYIYGLVSGVAHGKATGLIKPESAKKAADALRIIQPTTIYIALGAVCGLYFIFILSQLPYFFSAFTGNRPIGWLVYSEYARQGFFELCNIVFINLVIIMLGNVMCKKEGYNMKLFKMYNIILACITLVLIATAFSKMALYINVYGLTMRRLLPCLFMVFLSAVFVALIFLQKREFSILHFALIIGSVLLCILFLSNPDAIVIRYNVNRYLSGTLDEIDIDMLHSSWFAGVKPAVKVYDSITDNNTRRQIGYYLNQQKDRASRMSHEKVDLTDGGANVLSLEYYLARKILRWSSFVY
ncbi:MAG: DUF4173 domain-containing protein [Oscillospiraceae bacterium]|nr:DUF4173 domain-containing protein [Oscillospiraceae bacterium]